MPVANRTAARTPKKDLPGPIGKQLGLDPKDVVKSLVGVLTKVYPPKDFTGSYGPYTIQNLEMDVDSLNDTRLDESVSVQISVFSEEIPDDFINTMVSFSSVKLKGALQGVSYETNTKGDKLYENFKVAGKTALIEQVGGDDAGDAAPPSKPAQKEPEPERKRQEAPPKESTVVYDRKGDATSEEIVAAACDVHMLCLNFVHMNYKLADEGAKVAAAATIFINADRAGAVTALLRSRRNNDKPVTREVPQDGSFTPEYDPKNWAATIIPSGEFKGKTLAAIGNENIKGFAEFMRKKCESTGKAPSLFMECVFQAAKDLGLDKAEPEDDDIPY